MLRTYGPGCDGSPVDAEAALIPDGATWVDLDQPTTGEEALVERCIRMDVLTKSEMAEIEPSSRLFERRGALYMTISVLFGVVDGRPSTTPVSFVLTDDRLVTVRYCTPKPIQAFSDHARRDAQLVATATGALINMLDLIIDRLADELENISGGIEQISSHIFHKDMDGRRIPAARLTALLTRIGRTQTLLATIRYSAVSTMRMLSFLTGSHRIRQEQDEDLHNHIASLTNDVTSLGEHANFLSDNLQFLLDASLGLISVEQNAAMKLFSWAALVFLPPTLIAGIYGMNFKHMPELEWVGGYPWALALMISSAVLPILYLKRRGWI